MNNWQEKVEGRKFIASFSGGKDSVLALYKACQLGEVVGLINMLDETGEHSHSHRLSLDLLAAQARAIGCPVYTRAASWATYEEKFMELLAEAKAAGAQVVVTGDIDIADHGTWNADVTKAAGIDLCMPLWQSGRRAIVEEFIDLGFVTIVTTVNLSLGMRVEDLGKMLTHDYIDELEARGIDPCGEAGEFHTTVLAGPLFSTPIEVQRLDIVKEGNYAFLPLAVV